MADNKPTDTVGPPAHFMSSADQPLVMQLGCSGCGNATCIIGVVVPGFHYPCNVCERKVEKGLVIGCAACGKACCAPCVYRAYMDRRATLLTGD